MVDKIAFTPRVQTPAFKGIAEEAAPVIVEQAKDETDNKYYSGLLTGTLAALSAFGLGLVARKPKTVEKVVEKVVTETALHELSHKAGGDESAEFSYKLTNVNKDAIDMLMNDVQTRNEMQALSNLWNSLD